MLNADSYYFGALNLLVLHSLSVQGRQYAYLSTLGSIEKLFSDHLDELIRVVSKNKVKNPLQEIEKQKQRWLDKQDQLKRFLKFGGRVIGGSGPFELGRLQRAPTPPLCAFARGDVSVLHARPQVAIVGSRQATPKGYKRTKKLAYELAMAGCTIVSGGAMGVDMAAHEGALEAGGHTLAILGEPVKLAGDERPVRIRELAPSQNVTTLTTFGPDVQPGKGLFVSRNQYVAAMADAVIVTEGAAKSGALHTANYAEQIRVPVWAMPGDIDDPMSAASNLLLEQQKARALVHVETLLATLSGVSRERLLSLQRRLGPSQDTQADPSLRWGDRPTKTNHPILEILEKYTGRLTLDDLCENLKLPVVRLQQELLQLELMGEIKKEGMEFVLVAR